MKLPFKYGVISEVKPGYAKVYFEEDDLVTDWWPVLMRTSLKDKESWPLNVQEHVVCLCDERLEEGVVLGAIHNEEDVPDSGAAVGKFRKVFEDGTIIEYDKSSHKLTATIEGDVTIEANNITAKASVKGVIEAPTIELKGNVTVLGTLSAGTISATGTHGNGKITSSADIETTGDIKAGSVSLKTHIHGGISTGTGTTGTPQ